MGDKKSLLLGWLFVWAGIVVLASCQASNPMGASSGGGGGGGGGPTATPTPYAVGAVAGPSFSPSSLSIPVGSTVSWTSSLNGHTVDMDNGAGVCSSNLTTFPNSTVFNSTGTFQVHCTITGHSSCGVGTCTGCTGMVMTITVF